MAKLRKLFINEGLDTKILLLSNKKNIRSVQLKAKLDKIGLITGRNICLIDDIFQFSVKFNEEKTVKINIEYNEDINIQNYGMFLLMK